MSPGRVALVLFGLLACAPGGTGSQSTDPGAAAGPPSALAGRVGEALELSVPLVGGGRVELAELRGRPVLLELSDATVADRDAAQDRYRALVEQRGDAVVVITVALDAEAADLPAAWTDAQPPFVLGWDPQGALAARLQLVTLPTVVLLDEQGHIVAVYEGESPSEAALAQW